MNIGFVIYCKSCRYWFIWLISPTTIRRHIRGVYTGLYLQIPYRSSKLDELAGLMKKISSGASSERLIEAFRERLRNNYQFHPASKSDVRQLFVTGNNRRRSISNDHDIDTFTHMQVSRVKNPRRHYTRYCHWNIGSWDRKGKGDGGEGEKLNTVYRAMSVGENGGNIKL